MDELRELHKLVHALQAQLWSGEERAVLIPILEWVEARLYLEVPA